MFVLEYYGKHKDLLNGTRTDRISGWAQLTQLLQNQGFEVILPYRQQVVEYFLIFFLIYIKPLNFFVSRLLQ